MKQLHDLNGKIVLIDWVGEEPKEPKNDSQVSLEMHMLNHAKWEAKVLQALKSAMPTLDSDKQTWLELSARCGGKLEEGVHYQLLERPKLDNDGKYSMETIVIAYPAPQIEDLWEELLNELPRICMYEAPLEKPDRINYIKNKLSSKYHLTRKS